jgi:hypothetical protein
MQINRHRFSKRIAAGLALSPLAGIMRSQEQRLRYCIVGLGTHFDEPLHTGLQALAKIASRSLRERPSRQGRQTGGSIRLLCQLRLRKQRAEKQWRTEGNAIHGRDFISRLVAR